MQPIRSLVVGAAALAVNLTACARPAASPSSPLRPPPSDWVAYGRTLLGDRFSPLAQITRENVGRLVQVWSFSTGEATDPRHRTRRRTSLEATPLVVDGVLYFSTPLA